MKHFDALLSNAVFAVLGLVSFLVLSRGVTPAIFGSWILFLSISTFLDLVRFGLTRNATIRLISGTDQQSSNLVNAAALRAGIILNVVISLLFLAIWAVGRHYFSDVYASILLWYPLVALSNLMWNNALTWLQAKFMFRQTIILRMINLLSFVAMSLWLIYVDKATFINLILIYIVSNVLSSLYSMFRGWDSMKYLLRSSNAMVREILSFGKYSVLSNIGSSLLKSADSFIIGLSPFMGVTAIATYAIPFKIVEMLELPIRSISMVGYNQFSQAVTNGSPILLRGLMARYAIIMSILTLPVIIGIGLFPDLVLNILGGQQYAGSFGEMRIMLYMLIIYGIMLIPDRLTGIALEAMRRPELNTLKITAMTICNILGDVIAVFVFKSLIGVVFATVSFVILGVSLGYLLIPKEIRPSWNDCRIEFFALQAQWKTYLQRKRFTP